MAESISLSTTSKGKTCLMDSNNYCYHLNNYKDGCPCYLSGSCNLLTTFNQHKSWLCSVKGCNTRLKATVNFNLVGKIPCRRTHALEEYSFEEGCNDNGEHCAQANGCYTWSSTDSEVSPQ